MNLGGITSAKGFRAAGVSAGIKADAPDLALVFSDTLCSVAGVFTSNRMEAAPVTLSRQRALAGTGRAVVINSGCANACTGPDGFKDAESMARAVAGALSIPDETVYVCSTGTIGKRLPMARVLAGIQTAVTQLGDHGDAAARAIMTTDVSPKSCAVTVNAGGVDITVGGMAKGAGMIDPRLATMLALVTTDAQVDAAALRLALRASVDKSFNRVCVDGDQSTNDTVLVFANGAAGGAALSPSHKDWSVFAGALDAVTLRLAKSLVEDGEGASKFVTVTVTGAYDTDDALTAARAISRSALVKTAFFGADPNWGRVVCAVGYSGARLAPSRLMVRFDDLVAVRNGCPATETDQHALGAVFAQPSFEVVVDLGVGQSTDTVYTCDLGYEYVKINAEYMT